MFDVVLSYKISTVTFMSLLTCITWNKGNSQHFWQNTLQQWQTTCLNPVIVNVALSRVVGVSDIGATLFKTTVPNTYALLGMW